MYFAAAALAASYGARFAQSGTIDLQAGAAPDPDFGGEKVDSLQAAGVLSFNGTGKMVTAKPLSHFLVSGNTVTTNDVVELPEADFKRMAANGQVREATDEEVAASQESAQKAAKK